MPSITVPEGYSYVIAAATSTVWLNFWQFAKVGAARKASGITYPQMYAEKAEAAASPAAAKFNCVQRAHQNTLESIPFVLLTTILSGLKFPYLTASFGGAWVIGRVLYTIGYATGDPAKRNSRGGILSSLASIGLYLTSTYTAYLFYAEGL